MSIITQIIVGVVSGIVSLGLLVFVFRHIFNRLDKKVDKEVFKEYTLRISENLESGKRRFDKIDLGLEKISEQITELCVLVKREK